MPAVLKTKPPRPRLKVFVTRKLPATVEARMGELFDVVLNVEDRKLSREELIEAMRVSDVLVPTVTDRIDVEMLSQIGGKLKLIANYGAGVDHLDVLAARQRGVRIRIIVPGAHIDSEAVRLASKAEWGPLLQAGVAIHEYTPTMMHNKLLIVDGLMVSVGSTNFDVRSFRLNDEASLNVYDEVFAAEMTKVFQADLENCREYTYEMWKNRSLKQRVLEKMAKQLNAYDEASLMQLWQHYAMQVNDFEPTKRWEEHVLAFGMIQALHMKNQLFNHQLASASRMARKDGDNADSSLLISLGQKKPAGAAGEDPKNSQLGLNTPVRCKILPFKPRD